jgi:hypothetical protein
MAKPLFFGGFLFYHYIHRCGRKSRLTIGIREHFCGAGLQIRAIVPMTYPSHQVIRFSNQLFEPQSIYLLYPVDMRNITEPTTKHKHIP